MAVVSFLIAWRKSTTASRKKVASSAGDFLIGRIYLDAPDRAKGVSDRLILAASNSFIACGATSKTKSIALKGALPHHAKAMVGATTAPK